MMVAAERRESRWETYCGVDFVCGSDFNLLMIEGYLQCADENRRIAEEWWPIAGETLDDEEWDYDAWLRSKARRGSRPR
jgi:hypothetical protein